MDGLIFDSTSDEVEEEIVFSSFEKLQELLSDGSKSPAASLLCTAENLTITDDLDIPSGVVVTFRNFTVPEGVSLSVMEHSEVRTYSLTVQGNLTNYGTVIQQDLLAPWADEEIEITATIPGHVENKGEMVLTDVFGKRNINRFGGHLTMNETYLYQDKLRIASGVGTAPPTMEAVSTPEQTPALPEHRTTREIFDLLEDILPKLSFFLVLVCLFIAVKNGIASAREEKQGKLHVAGTNASEAGQSSGYGFPEEDHFQRDHRKRLEQLDDWLKNGLIDRKEYNELKRRYREDR